MGILWKRWRRKQTWVPITFCENSRSTSEWRPINGWWSKKRKNSWRPYKPEKQMPNCSPTASGSTLRQDYIFFVVGKWEWHFSNSHGMLLTDNRLQFNIKYSGDFWTKNVTFIFFASDKKSFFFSYFCDQQIGNQVGKTLFLIKSEIPGALASGCSGFLQRFCKYTVFEYILCFFVIQRYWKRLLSCCLSLIVDIRCGKDGPRRLIVRGLMVRNVRSLDTGASDVRSFNRSGLYSVVTIRFASSMRQGSISSR